VNPTVLLDADFLSAFLKINRLDLIRRFYSVERTYVTPAVYRELAQTSLLPRLTTVAWIEVTLAPADELQTLRQDEVFSRLGAGEQESIALALTTHNAVFLSNDNQARHVARAVGVTVVNIPAFLLACKMASELTTDEIQQIIDDLWQQDHYRFRQDVRALLLS